MRHPYLIRPMRSTKLLNSFISGPRQLYCQMNPPPLIFDISRCMQRDSSRGCIWNYCHKLLSSHKSFCNLSDYISISVFGKKHHHQDAVTYSKLEAFILETLVFCQQSRRMLSQRIIVNRNYDDVFRTKRVARSNQKEPSIQYLTSIDTYHHVHSMVLHAGKRNLSQEIDPYCRDGSFSNRLIELLSQLKVPVFKLVALFDVTVHQS